MSALYNRPLNATVPVQSARPEVRQVFKNRQQLCSPSLHCSVFLQSLQLQCGSAGVGPFSTTTSGQLPSGFGCAKTSMGIARQLSATVDTFSIIGSHTPLSSKRAPRAIRLVPRQAYRAYSDHCSRKGSQRNTTETPGLLSGRTEATLLLGVHTRLQALSHPCSVMPFQRT